MDNILKVYNENGELEEIEVLDFYQLEEYDHEYVLYTKNEEYDNDNLITYISIINQIGENEYSFEKITNPEEEKKLDELIQQELDDLSS